MFWMSNLQFASLTITLNQLSIFRCINHSLPFLMTRITKMRCSKAIPHGFSTAISAFPFNILFLVLFTGHDTFAVSIIVTKETNEFLTFEVCVYIFSVDLFVFTNFGLAIVGTSKISRFAFKAFIESVECQSIFCRFFEIVALRICDLLIFCFFLEF